MSLIRSLLSLACLLVVCGPGVAAADLAEECRQIFEVGFGPPVSSLEPTLAHYETAKTLSPSDSRPAYALAVVHIKQNRYREALAVLADAEKLAPHDVHIAIATIWSNLALKKQPEGLAAMEKLAAMLGDVELGDKISPDDRTEAALFLGRMYAFLSGPAAGGITAPQLKQAEKRMTDALGTGLAATFVEGEQEVTDVFQELSLDTEQTQAQAKDKQEVDQIHTQERLIQEKAALADQQSQVSAAQRNAQEIFDREVAKLEAAIAPLDRQYAALDARASRVRLDLGSLERRIRQLLDLADNAQDRNEEALYRRDAQRAQFSYDQLRNEFRILSGQAAQIEQQRQQLRNQRIALGNGFEAERRKLTAEMNNITAQLKKIARDEKKNSEPATGATTRVRVAKTKLSVLATYHAFPVDRERDRVLATFAK